MQRMEDCSEGLSELFASSWMNKKTLFTHFSSTKAVDWPWTIWKFFLFSLHVSLGEVKRQKNPMQGKKIQINCRVQTQGRGVPKIRGQNMGACWI
jgi:hypothetical protein